MENFVSEQPKPPEFMESEADGTIYALDEHEHRFRVSTHSSRLGESTRQGSSSGGAALVTWGLSRCGIHVMVGAELGNKKFLYDFDALLLVDPMMCVDDADDVPGLVI